MIPITEIRRLLNAKPFVPFRILISDGDALDVPHPEFAWIWGNWVLVGEKPKSKSRANGWAAFFEDTPVRQISTLHITQIEKPLRRRPRRRATKR